ncbi:N-acetylneuraminate synthase family protein [Legionella sp. CNM-4043-24]|uniref:N-acetylneuraminate synthase family protein n=1 Tax=Legionella sp. CNM-4043-24 TaxID=3421646 RepID=UPI00403A8795
MEFTIADKTIGDGHPVFVIAEIGSNHNQDFDLALQHIDAAAEAGVDAVKFQTFKASNHVSRYAHMPDYLKGYDNIHELIRTLELNRDWQQALRDYATKKGVIFFSSPCDYDAVDGLEAIGAPAHKVASFDIPDLDLVRYIAKTGKPVLLSTGLADWMEIQRAVDVCRQEGNNKIALFQCTSLYPAPAHLSNLKAMLSMKQAFNVVTGYSDHTMGDTIPLAAVAMGASILEKHITLDRNLPGPDHAFAMEPDELCTMMRKIREIEGAMGDGAKNGPRIEEMDTFVNGRRSLHAKQDIKTGDIITEAMLVTKRPGTGIQPHEKNNLLGKKARVDIKADQWIDWSMV